MVFEGIFIVYSIVAIILASIGLCRKGMNKEVRLRIFNHQVTYHFIMLSTNVLKMVPEVSNYVVATFSRKAPNAQLARYLFSQNYE